MKDPIPTKYNWITAGYSAARKKRKRSASKKDFLVFVKKRFMEKGVDVELVVSAEKTIEELFWQVETLKDYVTEFTLALLKEKGKIK